jgi:hypothetical protein
VSVLGLSLGLELSFCTPIDAPCGFREEVILPTVSVLGLSLGLELSFCTPIDAPCGFKEEVILPSVVVSEIGLSCADIGIVVIIKLLNKSIAVISIFFMFLIVIKNYIKFVSCSLYCLASYSKKKHYGH